MHDFPLDLILNTVLIIAGILLLIIPIFSNGLYHKITIKDKRGRVIATDIGGFNWKGKLVLVLAGISLTVGVIKAVRDENTKNTTNIKQQISEGNMLKLSQKVDFLRAAAIKQFKSDSASMAKIGNSLLKKGFALDSNLNVKSVKDNPEFIGVSVTNSSLPHANINHNTILYHPVIKRYYIDQ